MSKSFIKTQDEDRCSITDEERRYLERMQKWTFASRSELSQYLKTRPGSISPSLLGFAGSQLPVASASVSQ